MQSERLNYYEENYPRLSIKALKYALRYKQLTIQDHEDCFMDSICICFEKEMHVIEIGYNPDAYFMTVFKNSLKNRLSQKNKEKGALKDTLHWVKDEELYPWTDEQLASAIKKITRSENSEQILIMYVLHNESNREIARKLGLSQKYVERKKSTLFKKLVEQLKQNISKQI